MKRALIFISLFISLSLNGIPAFTTNPKLVAESVYICISKGAKRYHSRECHGLARCTHEIKKVSKEQAVKLKYTPCKICY